MKFNLKKLTFNLGIIAFFVVTNYVILRALAYRSKTFDSTWLLVVGLIFPFLTGLLLAGKRVKTWFHKGRLKLDPNCFIPAVLLGVFIFAFSIDFIETVSQLLYYVVLSLLWYFLANSFYRQPSEEKNNDEEVNNHVQ